MKKIVLFLVLSILSSSCSLFGGNVDNQLKVQGLFADNMVLQRDIPIKIWGWAKPDAKISIKFDHKNYHVKANDKGVWKTEMKPHKAGGPYEIYLNSGANKITIHNVLVGDVFFAVGESNMEWSVSASDHYEENLANADNYQQIRFVNVKNNPLEKPGKDIEAKWLVNNRSTVGLQSAVAYSAAKRIYDSVEVPIGIIHSSWANTKIEYWMSKKSLASFDEYKEIFKNFLVPLQYWLVGSFELPDILYSKDLKIKLGDGNIPKTVWFNGVKLPADNPSSNIFSVSKNILQGTNQINIRLRPSDSSVEKIQAYAETLSLSEIGVSLPSSFKISQWQALTQTEQEYPTVLFNSHIATVIPFDIKAIFWYQGEANVANPDNYDDLFKALVADWRARFKNDKLPFFSVQLASYKETVLKDNLAKFRLVQHQLTKDIPLHYMATAVDLGDADGDVHPKEKEEVGARLSNLVLKYLYGKKNDADNLEYKSFKSDKTSIIIYFAGSTNGLFQKNTDGLNGFEWVSKTGSIVPAKIKVEKNSIRVFHDGLLANYSALRYAWSDMPITSIYNSNSVPLLPFFFRLEDKTIKDNGKQKNIA
jgi:sialate O-acetylesterase